MSCEALDLTLTMAVYLEIGDMVLLNKELVEVTDVAYIGGNHTLISYLVDPEPPRSPYVAHHFVLSLEKMFRATPCARKAKEPS